MTRLSPRTFVRAIALVVLLVAIVAVVYLNWKARDAARTLLENPMETRRLPGLTPFDAGMIFDDVAVMTADGLRLVGWYVPTRNGAVVIAQHGYKGDRGEMLEEARMLERHGYGVLVSSIRAHDLSDGTTITFGRAELQDLRTWYEFLRRQPGVDASRIGMLGNSLGGTLALQFAADTPGVRAVAAHSAFSSLEDTVEKSVRFFTGLPPFPFAPLIVFWAERQAGVTVRDVDATQAIGRISPRAVLLMQGGADVVISIESGRKLYEAAREPRELWFEPTLGHTRFDTALPGEFERRVVGFFNRHLLGSGIEQTIH